MLVAQTEKVLIWTLNILHRGALAFLTFTFSKEGWDQISYHVPFLMCNLSATPAFKGLWGNGAQGRKQNILFLLLLHFPKESLNTFGNVRSPHK